MEAALPSCEWFNIITMHFIQICILAHSLGNVILHDILTGWKPEYEQESTDAQQICRVMQHGFSENLCLYKP